MLAGHRDSDSSNQQNNDETNLRALPILLRNSSILSFLLQTVCARRRFPTASRFSKMATVDLLLSSSPPGFAGCQTVIMSSSPAFPSPSALVRKRPQLKSGSRPASTPAFATLSFTPTVHLLNERQSTTKAAAASDELLADKAVKTKTSRKPRAVEKVIDGDEPIVKKPRKPRVKKAKVESEDTARDTAAPVEKAPRKPRAKKDATESQAKIPKGRATKASAGPRVEKAGKSKKTAVVSSHFASAAMESTDPFDISNVSENDLLLQEAVKRRRSWTPPKTAAHTSIISITRAEKDGVGPSLPSAVW